MERRKDDKCIVLDGNDGGSVDHLYELPASTVRRWFGSGRYGRIGTIGDGSCFFHSLCKAINFRGVSGNGTPYEEASMAERKAIVTGLREWLAEGLTVDTLKQLQKAAVTPNHKTLEEVQRMLRAPKVWADEIIIKWTSKALGYNIVFMNLANNSNTMYCGVHDKRALESCKACERPDVVTIVVAWVNREHFELLVRIDDPDGPQGVVVRKAFSPSDPRDLATVQALMRAYGTVCGI